MPTSAEPEDDRQYLFVVARGRPDLLARAQQSFGGQARIEIVPDRRLSQRRRLSQVAGVERRSSDRRRASAPAIDGAMRPTLLVRKYVPTYPGLIQENERLQLEVRALKASLLALTTANVIRRTSSVLAGLARQLEGDEAPRD